MSGARGLEDGSFLENLAGNLGLVKAHIDKHPAVAKRMLDVLTEWIPSGASAEGPKEGGSVHTRTLIEGLRSDLEEARAQEREGLTADHASVLLHALPQLPRKWTLWDNEELQTLATAKDILRALASERGGG